ncbi:MAG: Gfo/Idh/MocA family oxidoreductase, partial [Chloroflexota bacterium]|nr:Gfo/Idh/MocA family oxidoreductase [Chloroflexota bacterium]
MGASVRTGIIGCGGIAVQHAAALASLPESTFTACCDVDEARARALAEQFGVPHVFTDLDELLRSGTVDALCVCTPHPSHAAIVIAAARAGVHVLVEKPIAVELAEADAMVEAAERGGITFGGIFQRRFWPAAQRIRAAIDDGKLGRLTLAECQVRIWRPRDYFARDAWRGKWATEGGGALMNQGIHAIDLMQWFMGPVTEIYGKYATLQHADYIDVEDTVVATVAFANGALGTIEAATTISPEFGFRVAVHGDSHATASVWERPEGVEGVIDIWTVDGTEEYLDVFAPGRATNPGFPEFHRLQIQEFLQAIIAGRQPAVTGAEARKALEIILAIYESSRTGRPVSLPLDRVVTLAAPPA